MNNTINDDKTNDGVNDENNAHQGGVVEDIGDGIQKGIDDVEDAVDGKDEANR
jgi:hypothetical protein